MHIMDYKQFFDVSLLLTIFQTESKKYKITEKVIAHILPPHTQLFYAKWFSFTSKLN